VGNGLALIASAAFLALADAPPAPDADVADVDLIATVREVAEHVARLREGTFVEPPVAVRASAEHLRSLAERRAARWLPPESRGPRGRAWSDLGLGDERALDEVLHLLSSDVSDMKVADGRLLVVPGVLPPHEAALLDDDETQEAMLMMTGVARDEPIAAHHLVHLLQGGRGGMDPPASPATTDALLARLAWIEGEANLVALLYLFEGMGLAAQVVDRGIEPDAVLDGRLAPPAPPASPTVVSRFREFVYIEGFAQTVERYAAGGWEAVDRAAGERTTTASVLHSGEPAIARPAAAKPTPPVGGVRLADEDSIGEQGVVELVSKLTGKDNLALLAGEGWRDDRLFRWETGSGDGATEWRTRWATPEDAADFDYAYRRAIGVLCGTDPEAAGGTWRASCRGRVWVSTRAGDEMRVRIHPATWDPWLPRQE